ncbi:MAG TPA: CHAT domain-containing protein [Streptosporangiaceae bacterium]
MDVRGPLRWRWLLSDGETGMPLADHRVELDPDSAEVARFADLYGYAREHAAPDRRLADGSRIVAEAGTWAGRELLGEPVGAALATAARAGPVTVRVEVPAELDRVLLWPLELAYVNSKPLAARGDVTFVYDFGDRAGDLRKDATHSVLRVLAVFSLPTRTTVLALRRERYALRRFIRRIAARQRAAVELRVVQYGVTRKLLGEIVDDGDGWDIVHLSGHGNRGLFYLERPDGSPDAVDTAGLLDLLRPGRRRVKLAVLSACQSAADTTAEALRLVGLPEQADAADQEQESAGHPTAEVTGLARSLVRELDCAVVAMRYPVIDEFAIRFGEALYEHLLGRGQPLDVAAARALAETGGQATSIATPGVFGARAAGLVLKPPRGNPLLDPAEQTMAYFPAEPERFVGRATAMAEASAALAPSSGRTAVLLHGMAGAGKTSCALELAYRHYDGFEAVAFWQAATKDDEWATALPSLATALEIQLGDYGFTMTGHIGTTAALEKFLPRLRRILDSRGVLLVLDNLETLLTPDGTWHDPRFGPLIEALTGHDGESRLILTSRILPSGLSPNVLALPVHALSLQEAVALARELPNLRGLLHADPGPIRANTDAGVDQDRDRVRRVLHVVQGHPKLLELADAAAADRDQLDRQLDAAEAATNEQSLEAFFRDGTSTLDPDHFLNALAAWTNTALAALPDPARLMAEFLACLEDDDRQSDVIKANWLMLWQRLSQPGDPPDPDPLLEILATAALIQAEAVPQDAVVYRMHPGVAAAIAATDPEIRGAADAELAEFWYAVASRSQNRESEENSGLFVHAALAATPYLLRQRDWNAASALLDHAIIRDESPATIQAALPTLRRVAEGTRALVDRGVLARALSRVDPAGAERLLDDLLHDATAAGEWHIADAGAAVLANLLRRAGRLGEALDANTRRASYVELAGHGPWVRTACEAERLQILGRMGEHEQVLAESSELLTRMRRLPAPSPDETVEPWNVREHVLHVSHTSALALSQWQLCLDLNAQILANKRQRNAGMHELARSWFNDVGPLIELRRLTEAGKLLEDCQEIFEQHHDIDRLAWVFGGRSWLEDMLGNHHAAVELIRTALRLGYDRPDPRVIVPHHHNLATYLHATGTDPAEQRAHRLAAALIGRLAGMAHELTNTKRILSHELRSSDADALPTTLAEVIEVAERTEGVRLAELISALEPDAQVAEEALAQILRRAAEAPPPMDQPADTE